MLYLILIASILGPKLYIMSGIPELYTQPLFFPKLILSDLGFILILVLLLGINNHLYLRKNIYAKLSTTCIKTVSILMLICYLVDTIIIIKFYNRFYIDYVFSFLNLSLIRSIEPNYPLLVVSTIILSILIRHRAALKLNRHHFTACLILCCCCYVWTNTRDENRWSNLSLDIISVNLNASFLNTYSDSFTHSFSWQPKIETRVLEPLARPKNIFLIPIESWSYKHSKYFSQGMGQDWTPALDRLAQQNIALTNLYANGYMTEHGLFALLTGMLPLFYSASDNLNISMDNVASQPSLVKILHRYGYHTTFFSGAPKNFLHKDEWLTRLGIEKVVDNGDFPAHERRYIFGAVSDEVLFNGVDAFLQSRPDNNLIIIENTQTHVPFYVPSNTDGYQISEQRVFQYTDSVIASFIDKHNTTDNLFIIVADHRSMQSTTSFERTLSGKMAAARIPAFIIWNNSSAVIMQAFSQVDIYALIKRWISGEELHSFIHGQIYPFNASTASECQFFARGDNRSYVSVKCGEQEYSVVLDADNSYIKERENAERLMQPILNWIHWSRLRHLQ